MKSEIAIACALLMIANLSAIGQTVFGDTYSVGLTSYNALGGGGAFVVGSATVDFDGVDQFIGPSVFGDNGDTMTVSESITPQGGNLSLISIDILARDAGGALTNWFADGSVSNTGDPFTTVYAEFGVFNGGFDKLDPTNGGSAFTLVSAEYWLIGTLGSTFGSGSSPFTLGNTETSDASGISGSGGVSFGADIATTELSPGEEFAGYQILLTVSTVPEPSSLLLSSIGILGLFQRRR